MICCRSLRRGGTIGVVVCVFVSEKPSFMLMSPNKNNKSDEPFLTIIAFVVLTISNRFMYEYPFGSKPTI